MDDRDYTGGIAAAAALALVAGTWAWSPAGWAQSDRAGLEQASQQALEFQGPGQTLIWQSSEGTNAAITPATAFRASDGRWCRPYSVVLDTDAATARQHVGCRDDGGRWSTPIATVAQSLDAQVAALR